MPFSFEMQLRRRFSNAFEFGISRKLKDGVTSADFGFDSTEALFHVCLHTNDMSSLHSVYHSITLFNLKTLVLVLFSIYGLIVISIFLDFLWFKSELLMIK